MKKLNKSKENVSESKKTAGFVPENHQDNSTSFNTADNLNNAVRLINNGELNDGKILLDKILKFDPKHRNSIKALSNVYLQTGKKELGIKLVSNYLKINPNDSEFMNIMGVYLNSIGEHKLARLFYKKSLIFAKDNEIILKNLEMTEDAYKKDRNKKISPRFLYLLELTENKNILKPSIALCMIVKNEEKNLPKCLNSVKGIVNEIVIVDTGSTDKTKEIAQSFGAEVRNYRWDDDFAKARSESIRDINSDWILYLDADEYLDSSDRTFFDNLKNTDEPLAFYIKIISFTNQTNNIVESESISLRLFNNKKGFTFKGSIHEQLILNGSTEEYEKSLSSVILKHTGYMEDEISRKNKNNRNYDLLIKALQDEPENSFNYYNMGVQLLVLGKHAEAIDYFHQTLKKLNGRLASYLPFCYTGISMSYGNLNKFEQAAKFGQKAIEVAPNLKEAYYCLANAQLGLNDNENALANFNKILEMEDEIFLGGTKDTGVNNWKSLNSAGTIYLKMEDYENALKYFWQAYKIENKSAAIIYNLLVAHKNIGKLDTFLQVLSDIKGVEFSVGQTQQMVNIFLLFKKFDEAFSILNKVLDYYTEKNLKKDTEGLDVSILKENMASIYFAKNDYKNALVHYEEFFKISEGTHDSYKNSGVCYFNLADYLKAEYYFEKSCKHDVKSLDSDWEIYHNIGIVKMKLEKLSEALVYLKKSISLNPNDSEAHVNLGKIYLINKEYDSANAVFESDPGFIAGNPGPEILFYNSEALYFLERFEEALNNLFIYLEKAKEDEEAYNKIGLCFHKLNQYGQAADYFSKAIEVNNKNPNYFYNLGNCLFEAGSIEDAKLAYNCALILDSNHVPSIASLQILEISEKIKI